MKKVLLITLATVVAAFGLSSNALAFHGGGVGHCDGCHSMHATTLEEGASENDKLLVGSDASSACLACHAGSGTYHVLSTDGSNYTPGGDFYWINAGSWSVSHSSDSTDFTRGHNIVAADLGLIAEGNIAPGGTYDSANLGCTSCHDAHGEVDGGTDAGGAAISGSGSYGGTAPDGYVLGNFRLLGDSSYIAGDHEFDGFAFTQDDPIATAVDLTGIYRGLPAVDETDSSHTDYGSNMSEWCANCHGDFITGGNVMHPAGNNVSLSPYITNYNKYVASGDFTGADTDAFDALVPIERGTSNREELSTSSTFGADAKSRVMCLSCHRSHAGGFDSMTRWALTDEILTQAETGISFAGDDYTDAYYGRDMATAYDAYQRQLCNKCHVQD